MATKTAHKTDVDDLLMMSDAELLDHAHAIEREIAEFTDTDDLFELIEEVFERFAPAATLQRHQRHEPQNDRVTRLYLARRAFQRTYGVTFLEVADAEDV